MVSSPSVFMKFKGFQLSVYVACLAMDLPGWDSPERVTCGVPRNITFAAPLVWLSASLRRERRAGTQQQLAQVRHQILPPTTHPRGCFGQPWSKWWPLSPSLGCMGRLDGEVRKGNRGRDHTRGLGSFRGWIQCLLEHRLMMRGRTPGWEALGG